MLKLKPIYEQIVREAVGELNFLQPGTEIELFDNSPGAPEGGAWLQSRIRKRIIFKDQRTRKKRCWL
jgi:hypothetical protein